MAAKKRVAKKPPAKGRRKVRSGQRKDLNDVFFRSGWEANVARILNHKKIKWDYERDIYVFHGLTRGKVAYTPDFWVTKVPRKEEYKAMKDIIIEVKGRMNSGDYTKLLNFKKQYPGDFARLRGIVRKNSKAHKSFDRVGIPILWFYDDLVKSYSHIIKEWE